MRLAVAQLKIDKRHVQKLPRTVIAGRSVAEGEPGELAALRGKLNGNGIAFTIEDFIGKIPPNEAAYDPNNPVVASARTLSAIIPEGTSGNVFRFQEVGTTGFMIPTECPVFAA